MKKILPLVFLTLVFGNNCLAAPVQAPDVHLPTTDGEVQLASLRGKVVYLDFWASWCLPCKKSFPWMHEMKQQYADQGLEIVAVNLDKDRGEADAFLRQMQVNFIVAFDEKGDTASMYQLKGMPSSYLIGRDGKVRASHVGFRESDKLQLEQAVKRLLDQ